MGLGCRPADLFHRFSEGSLPTDIGLDVDHGSAGASASASASASACDQKEIRNVSPHLSVDFVREQKGCASIRFTLGSKSAYCSEIAVSHVESV